MNTAILHYTALHHIQCTIYSASLCTYHYTTQYTAVCTAPHYISQKCTTVHHSALHYTTLYYITPLQVTLNHTTVHSNIYYTPYDTIVHHCACTAALQLVQYHYIHYIHTVSTLHTHYTAFNSHYTLEVILFE